MKYDDIPLEVLIRQMEKMKINKWTTPIGTERRLIVPRDLPPAKGPFPEAPPNKRVVIFDI